MCRYHKKYRTPVQKETKPEKEKAPEAKDKKEEPIKETKSFLKRAKNMNKKVEDSLLDQFKTGRLMAAISSRPGQSGRVDGYILEGNELDFYLKKIEKKKQK